MMCTSPIGPESTTLKIASEQVHGMKEIIVHGRASEVSEATFTDHVAGDICKYVCIIRASSPWANYSTRMRKWC